MDALNGNIPATRAHSSSLLTPVDVAVIGGGIGGAAVAAELARDHRVALLEAEQQAAYHSTGRSVAMLDLAYGNAVVQALTVASAEPLRELQEWAADALPKAARCLVCGAPRSGKRVRSVP